jgi:hypothetical protein
VPQALQKILKKYLLLLLIMSESKNKKKKSVSLLKYTCFIVLIFSMKKIHPKKLDLYITKNVQEKNFKFFLAPFEFCIHHLPLKIETMLPVFHFKNIVDFFSPHFYYYYQKEP